MSSLRSALVEEYKDYKVGLKAGARKQDLTDMTDRECAGMYVFVYADNALVAYDAVLHDMENHPHDIAQMMLRTTPSSRDLILEATGGFPRDGWLVAPYPENNTKQPAKTLEQLKRTNPLFASLICPPEDDKK